MADTRQHRGAHPEDAEAFAPHHWPALRRAIDDLCWLLDRDYAVRSALALVGDRYRLTQRQRIATARCACSSAQRERRLQRQVASIALAGNELWIDGFNLLVTLEAALAGGPILLGRDGCCRDMASVHGTYREVSETIRAAKLVGVATERWRVAQCHWLLDRPVGNSGRLKSTLEELAVQFGWCWDVALEFDPDRLLVATAATIATSDSAVLDGCDRWCNVAYEIVTHDITDATMIDLRHA